jgi:hypothetical protein
VLVILLLIAIHSGDERRAADYLPEALALAQEHNQQRMVVYAMLSQAMLTILRGDDTTACQVASEAIAIAEQSHAEEELAYLQGALGLACRRLGQTAQAWQAATRALESAVRMRAIGPVCWGLVGAAALILDEGQVARAIELLALGRRIPMIAQSEAINQAAGWEVEAAARQIDPAQAQEAAKRGQQGDPFAAAAELLAAYKARVESQEGQGFPQPAPSSQSISKL